MPKETKEFRYNDRQRQFDSELEESMASFAGGTATNDSPQYSEDETKSASEAPALDRIAWTASDDVATLANLPVDAEKVSQDILSVDIREKLQKLASWRSEFILDFLNRSGRPRDGA